MTQRARLLAPGMIVMVISVAIATVVLPLFGWSVAAGQEPPAGDVGQSLRVIDIDSTAYPAVDLTVTVPEHLLADDGGPPTGLLLEDGQPRPIVVRPLDGPVHLGLVIDTSASMHGTPLAAAADAARACLGGLPTGSSAFLITYSDAPRVDHGLSPELLSVSRAIDSVVAVGETATHDALIAASAEFANSGAGTDTTDRFVVLLSDGTDNASQTSLAQAIAALATIRADVYAVALQTDQTEIDTLKKIAAGTDGVLIESGPSDLIGHCGSISREISNRYVVSYTSLATNRSSGGASGSQSVELSLGGGAGAAGSSAGFEVAGGEGLTDGLATIFDTDADAASPWTPSGAPVAGGGLATAEIPIGAEGGELAEGGLPSAMTPPVGATSAAASASTRALWVGAGAIFVGLTTMFSLAFVPSQSAMTAKRLKLRPSALQDNHSPGRFGRLGQVGAQAGRLIDAILARAEVGTSLNASLDAAGINLRPGEYVAMFVGGAIGVFFFLAAAGFGGAAALAFIVVPLLGHFYLKHKSSKRLAAFQEQLVETLMIMAGSIRAGHGMMQSISSVADQASEPTASEFGRVITEVRIGRDPIDSLNAMAERVGSMDLTWTVRAMALNRELGGNLAEILDNVSNTIRERNKIADQVKALSAEGKFSAYVLFGLPFGVVFAVRMLNPEYIEPLFNTGMGQKIIAASLTMMTIGAIWIRKMIKIEY